MLSEIEQFIIRIKNTVTKINMYYENYNKLYLGYSIGGFMVNNFIFGKNIVGYTYNSFGFKINDNDDSNLDITNYCQELDALNIFWRINKQNSIIINSFTNIFNPIDYLDINSIKKLYKLLEDTHMLYKVKNDKIIEIYF